MKNVIISIFLILTFCFAALAQGTTQYVYDANGRLTAVVLPGGESAIYTFDAAGNIVSITRQNFAPVSISGFMPAREFAGTQVTIQGTGFIPDITQNTVQFNGVNATVTSATTNELAAIIPENSSTGKITVTNINGSATSVQNFTPLRLLIPNDPPQTLNFDFVNKSYSFRFAGITGKNISLLIDQVSSVYQITVTSQTESQVFAGTYLPFNNKIFLDKTLLSETGEYVVEITATNSGTTSENANFSLYQFNDLAGIIPNDESPFNLAITHPGQDAILDLSVPQNSQTMYLNIANSTLSSVFILIKSPTGAYVTSVNIASGNHSIQLQNVPLIGVYKVEVNPGGEATGTASVKYSINPLNEIVVDGSPLALTIPANQHTEVTFNENAGQRVFIDLNTGPFLSVNVKIFKPNGALLSDDSTDFRVSGIDINSLPETGTYRIEIDPQSSSGGDIVISAKSTAAVGGLCPFNSNKTCFIKEIFAVAGQNVNLNLDVVNGGTQTPIVFELKMQQVSVSGTVAVFDQNNDQITIFPISETTVSVPFSNPGGYRITITPDSGQTGSFKFALKNLSFNPKET